MLYLTRGNHLESLADSLAGLLREPVLPVFQKETIVVQSLGMRRWLQLELAQRLGVAMNCDFPFPASFAQRVFQAAFPRETITEAFTRDVLPWRVLELLPNHWDEPGWEDLRRYAEGELGALKEFQLAQQIASVFDRYVAYRPEQLAEWERKPSSDWQPKLWRELTRRPAGAHPPGLLVRLAKLLKTSPEPIPGIPLRIAAFGLSTLPPLYLSLFEEIARAHEVHFYLLDPTPHFWSELRSPREQARLVKRSGKSASSLHLESGNVLLSSLGKVGRDFAGLMQNLDPAGEDETFVPPSEDSLLHRLQSDIYDLVDRPIEQAELQPNDGSVRIHCCHGPLREVEVLHDQLLDLFEKNPTLEPRDILVTMPDVEAYAPFIEAVFDSPEDPRQHIPFTIADRSARAESGLAETFLRLLDLQGSRFGAGTVLALLDCEAIRRRFELSEGDQEIIRHWVEQTFIRWGIDAAHRETLGQPPFPENTWLSGLERLLLGYALPGNEETLFDGILPVREVEGSLALTLGRFVSFAHSLFDLVPKLAQARPLRDWQRALRQLVHTFFDQSDDYADDLRQLHEVFTALGDLAEKASFTREVSFEVLRAHLSGALSSTESGLGFLAGRVTFCSLKPMRSIPFKVLCLLGLDDTAFPRQTSTPTFDLLAGAPKPGDRSPRDDDRQLFLESILSAREVLYLSYSGLSTRDNSESPPSVVVGELLDYLDQNFNLTREHLVVRHRLQAFSPEYFKGGERLFSYSAESAHAAADRPAPRRLPAALVELPEPDGDWRTVDLHRLAEFFTHPAKYFARERLRLLLADEEPALDETEPLQIHGLDGYQLSETLTGCALTTGSTEGRQAIARASGKLPPGYVGHADYTRHDQSAQRLAARIRELAPGQRRPALHVDLPFESWRLQGSFHDLHERAFLRYRATRLKPKDLVRAWVTHLALQLSPDAPHDTWLVGLETTWHFAPIPNAPELFTQLLERYAQGLRQPLPFFPQTSLEFAQRAANPGRITGTPADKAREIWEGGFGKSGEGEDPWFALIFPPETEPLNDLWQQVSLEIYNPLLAARKGLA